MANRPCRRGPVENERDYEHPQDAAVRATLEGRCPTARILLPDLAPAPSGETAEAQRSASAAPFPLTSVRAGPGGVVFLFLPAEEGAIPSRSAPSRRTQPDGEARAGASPSFPDA